MPLDLWSSFGPIVDVGATGLLVVHISPFGYLHTSKDQDLLVQVWHRSSVTDGVADQSCPQSYEQHLLCQNLNLPPGQAI